MARDPERFAGKINVPGSPILLRQWRPHGIVTRSPDDAMHRHCWGGIEGATPESEAPVKHKGRARR